jgi:2-phospho-L-lactate/phosphoenolpyruvate guanylyltransferase
MRNKCWLIIPVKSLHLSKQRLADTLSQTQRQALATAMLEDMLNSLAQCQTLAQIVLLSRDATVQTLAHQQKVDYWQEPPHCQSLNDAMQFAVQYATEQAIEQVMLLHGDIPLITAQDVDKAVSLFDADVGLIADAQQEGTNAMLLTLPTAMRLHYGQHSFARHRQQAEQAKLSCQVLDGLTSFQLDIDHADNLAELRALVSPHSCVGRLLASAEFTNR